MNVFFIFFNAYILKKIIDEKYHNRGCDERYIYHSDNFKDIVSFEKILKINEIENDIHLLQSNISNDDKLHFLNNNGVPSPGKMTNGGLMDDFLFKFLLD